MAAVSVLMYENQRPGNSPKCSCWVEAGPLGSVHPSIAGVDCDVVYVIKHLEISESNGAISRQRESQSSSVPFPRRLKQSSCFDLTWCTVMVIPLYNMVPLYVQQSEICPSFFILV